ncbi:MAG: acyl-CoA/acyl-ACP dehydrogenase [Proteobacteria bacterium]|nr:acyl-CoA/acyl-ACP dehydrogenase [Pseudomonadota bacterium]
MDALIGVPADELEHIRRLVPSLQNSGLVADAAEFPAEAIRRLAEAGALTAPLPIASGGLGLGTERHRGRVLLDFLHLLGQASLPLGRLVEAHVNALRIVARYGNTAQQTVVSAAVRDGALFALWVTDPPGDGGLSMVAGDARLALTGGKMFCSGAGFASHAVVTAADVARGETRLLLVDLGGLEHASPLPASLAGMKAAVTGQVDFTGVTLGVDRVIGDPGDYLREPDFSAGAWRSSAVALGGLHRLLDLLRLQLIGRGRQDDPHQRARFGQALIGHEAGWLLLEQAGTMAEDLEADSARIVSAVGLARIAVERACLDGIELMQRSLGIGAFLTGNPVERVARDLQTYLRQPAADEVLHNAAGYFMVNGLPAA